MQELKPPTWPRPVGYSNGFLCEPGRMVILAGQVGCDSEQNFPSEEMSVQFAIALGNILTLLREANAGPRNIARITAYCTDKQEYLASRKAIGSAWTDIMGHHFPAMSLIFVSELLDDRAKIELEATAVIPFD